MVELLKFISSICLVVITSYITVNFGLRRFYTEKWWERKAGIYTDIMELLYNYQLYVGKEIDDIQTNQEVEEEIDADEWTKRDVNQAHQKIEKIITIGTFIVSEEIIEVINELLSELHSANDEETYFEFLLSQHAALHKAISKFRDCAKRDLKINA